MKTILFLILNLLLYFPLFGDEPIDLQNPTCTECNTIPHRYPHFYCDGITPDKHTICLEIPIPEWQKKKKMEYKCFMKRNGVLCSKFDETSFPWTINSVDPENDEIEESWNMIIRGTSTGPKVVFDIRDLSEEDPINNPIKRAINQWSDVCERTDEPDPEEETCCINISFETNQQNLEDAHKTSIAVSNSKAKLSEISNSMEPLNDCNYECVPNADEHSFTIRFNATDEFTKRFNPPQGEGAPLTSLPRNFFISRDLIPNGSNIEYANYVDNEMRYFDIYTIIQHEVGHLLGFNHFNYTDKGVPCKDLDNTTDGIMNLLDDNKRKELTWRDRCAYKRLYCCTDFQRCYNNVSVQEDENNFDGKIP